MPRVVHFEVMADEVDRAIKFYTDVFGWKFNKWDGPMEYWLVTTGEEDKPGIDGGFMKRPAPGAVGSNVIDVPSVDEFLVKIANSGGKVVQPKMAIKGIGYVAGCQDTEGNNFSIIEEDSSAE